RQLLPRLGQDVQRWLVIVAEQAMRVAGEAIARQAGIENGDLAAGTAELQGAGETGKAAADDDHVIHSDGLRVVDGRGWAGLGAQYRPSDTRSRRAASRASASALARKSPMTGRSLSGAIAGIACSLSVPSTPQSPEGSNRGARDFGLRHCLGVSHLKQVAVSIQDFDETDGATRVRDKRILARTRERRFALCQDSE